MRDFYSRVVELLDRGREFIIAHLVEARGSAPQSPGAKLIVHPNGQTEFTIGGGALEAHVAKEAFKLAEHGKTLAEEYKLRDLGMYCGGAVRIFYEPIGEAKATRFYEGVRELLGKGQRFAIAHLVNPGGLASSTGLKMAIRADGEVDSIYCGSLPPELVAAIREDAVALLGSGKRAVMREFSPADPQARGAVEAEVFLEVVEGPLRLLIFGAGHVGVKLAELAVATGLFRVELADERAAPLEELEPFVERVYTVGQGYRGELPSADEQTFVAIITRSHETDKVVLQRILGSGRKPAYLGMIGSPRKREELFRMLIQEGIAEERLAQVHTPIGLPIGGKEPGEIAVSILAEVIKVKNAVEEG